MARKLMRVALDWNDYEINQVWEGYCPDVETFQKLFGDKYKFMYDYNHVRDICQNCNKNCGECSENASYCLWYNPDNKDLWYKEVPEGEGYQLWSTTTEGTPMTPVFEKLEDLCEYCEKEKVTVFADEEWTKEQWFEALK